MTKPILLLAIVTLLIYSTSSQATPPSAYKLQAITVSENLAHPWSLSFLPNNEMLVTERPGRLRLIDSAGKLSPAITNLPPIKADGQGGLLDVILHPNYEKTGWLYLSYASANKQGNGTEVARAKLDRKRLRLTELEVIFRMQPKTSSGHHFGSRMRFDDKGYLYITLGDRGEKDAAQQLNDHRGKIIRLHEDGTIPSDNPFYKTEGALAEIYSYGHRNPQGLSFHPTSNQLWEHEHGPQGGDEVNIILGGKNYGWPTITYGVNYFFGTKIGQGTHAPTMQHPIHYWIPKSIAPSGMSFYQGNKFPLWNGHLFIGALRDEMLVRLEIQDNKVIEEEHLLKGELGRIRDVKNGPDGYLYLLIDAPNGKVIRIQPAH